MVNSNSAKQSEPVSQDLLSTSQIVEMSGVTRDVLRKWEERYGFPVSLKTHTGECAYHRRDIEKLNLIRRLIAEGCRPRDVVGASLGDLQRLAQSYALEVEPEDEVLIQAVLDTLEGSRAYRLFSILHKALMAEGLYPFATQTVAKLNRIVGDLWLGGELSVYQEHIYTQTVHSVLDQAILSLKTPIDVPRVLIATPPGELHTISLKMLEAVLALEGIFAINAGSQLPVSELKTAVTDHGIDAIAISFSSACSKRDANAFFVDLVSALPQDTLIWCGGQGARGLSADNIKSSTRCFEGFEDFSRYLQTEKPLAKSTTFLGV
ncbi:MerR family transcriptional regulator [Magnetovibrio sp. PR-2]|uniref:MerR family transcriptional regulator n=1 Tax=Magnetovibrio sp. PR-2 TaxID=3120356 RepID=UPI002FCDEAE1